MIANMGFQHGNLLVIQAPIGCLFDNQRLNKWYETYYRHTSHIRRNFVGNIIFDNWDEVGDAPTTSSLST